MHRELDALTGSDAKAYPENFNTDIEDHVGNGGKAYFGQIAEPRFSRQSDLGKDHFSRSAAQRVLGRHG